MRLGLIILIIETPWLRNLLLVLLAVAAVVWIREQIKIQNEGDKLREADRNRGDSVWNMDNW